MTKFEPAYIPESEIDLSTQSAVDLWKSGNQSIVKAVNECAGHIVSTEEECRYIISNAHREAVGEVFKNDKYQVIKTVEDSDGMPGGKVIHLSIKRIDRQPILRDWRDLQLIKNELVGKYHEGVELFPGDDRLVDTSNQYHIYCMIEPNVRFPFGYTARLVSDFKVGKSVQRPFES